MEQSQTMEKLQQEVDLYINGFKEGYFPSDGTGCQVD